MNQIRKTIICVLLFVPIYFLLYAFLHEAGHALVILAYGGEIENFVFWNLNAHVSSSGGDFTTFGLALNHICGMLLPTIAGAIAIGFYKPGIKFTGYHICYLAVLLGLLGSMFVWVVIPIISLFALPPPGDDVTKFMSVTRFHPIIIALAVLLLAGAFVSLAYVKGLLSKETFQNVKHIFAESAENTDASTNSKLRFRAFIASAALLIMAISLFVVADHIPYVPSDAVFIAEGSVQNVFEEDIIEHTLVIDDSRVYTMNLDVAADGFVTALCIVNESGETYLQTNGEGFPHSVMTFGLDEGTYTLSLLIFTEYDMIDAFFEDTGFGELDPRDIEWINEALNRNITDYSVKYFITIR